MIFHVDMDAFFAAVEQRDNPALKGKCVLVGGSSRRGVVAAASYEARRRGVHSAMPMFMARRKCPEAVIISPRRQRYKAVSRAFMAILREISPLVEPVSIDEAWLDVSGCERLHGCDCFQLAQHVKKTVHSQLGLTCSIGVAPVKFLAKIASDIQKPDGLTIIPASESVAFARQLPIGKVPGVGPQMQAQLHRLGIKYLGDVLQVDPERLSRQVGKFGRQLIARANAEDDRPVETRKDPKSFSTEITLSHDTTDKALLAAILLDQAAQVGRNLRAHRLWARTVQLKIKYADFKSISRSRTLNRPDQSTRTLYKTAQHLLTTCRLVKPVRLIGLGAAGLASPAPFQMSLFHADGGSNAWEKVDKTADAIIQRFGKNSLGFATSGKTEKGKMV